MEGWIVILNFNLLNRILKKLYLNEIVENLLNLN